MKNTIVTKLRNALDILKDYPGISDTINLNEAQKFLKSLEKTNIGLVPDFKEIRPDQIQEILREDKAGVDDWINSLNAQKGVTAWKDTSVGDEYVICGNVAKDLATFQNGADDEEICFSFRTGDRASFDNSSDTTWEEVYLAIIKHVNENLIVPVLPET